ncbi:MAG TPA: aminopeptidase N [Methylomirabilota bacterium]|jgi:aminopeptidase N|nr:aminopeptidase N [Methylomirabilota bacterium]
MSSTSPQPIRREDYRVPDFLIDEVDLDFDLRDDGTTVRSRLMVRRNPAARDGSAPLSLDGEELGLTSVAIDGKPLGPDHYRLEAERLVIPEVPDRFELAVTTEIQPHKNSALSGLYVSGGNYCTQCEAEGFRRITFFADRPDVMARYTTRIAADKARYPVLLANGNPDGAGDLPGGRHWARWVDPFPKPSYLFALVAGDLKALEDRFTTRSGREVTLRIFARAEDLDKCGHAMASLKKAMRWDEEVYGREYDLDLFMIVAVSDFNFGAMENKGLNIFNTKYVLAKPETATDADYLAIEGVVAHEYFHNWTGNRITCRDWFQLSLKEGLTVFRDQEFSSDMNSRAVKRIADVRRLRAAQFPEDAGPTAHPVRPDSYIAIDNFYTPTVYEKGAEVIRMMHTLLGPEGFRAGMDLYFERHDGQAVTCEDFVKAMEDASGADLRQFRLWYAQAGTPEIEVKERWDEAAKALELTVRQTVPPTPGQPDKEPMAIPLALGLIDRRGADLRVRLEGENAGVEGTRVLPLRKAEERFRFAGLAERPAPSLLRGFSAPARLKPLGRDRLMFLFAKDSDPFARWEAGQQLAASLLTEMAQLWRGGGDPAFDPGFIEAIAATLTDGKLDPAFRAEAIALPSEAFLADQMEVADPEAIFMAREGARRAIAARLSPLLMEAYEANREQGPYRVDPQSVGRRALKNAVLSYLAAPGGAPQGLELATRQYRTGGNMTDVLAALALLADRPEPERQTAFADFYERWRDEALVIDKWFALQAMSRLPDTIERVRALLGHPAFTYGTPNRVYALIANFGAANPVRFHSQDGSGYRFLADQVLVLDPRNPQVASRIVTPLARWRRQAPERQELMKAELRRILATRRLSKHTYEIASKGLA